MEDIRGILARNQPERSQTWSEEKDKVCSRCSSKFTDKIWHIGNKIIEHDKCETCIETEKKAKLKTEAEFKLKEVNESQKKLWLENCGLPAYYKPKKFDNFDYKSQQKAFNAVKNLHWFTDNDNKAQSLVLASPGIYGVGKTHLVAALINQIIETQNKAYITSSFYVQTCVCPFYFTTENDLLRRIRSTFNRDDDHESETESEVYKKLSRYDLLVIDDVGKVRPKDNSFTQGVFFDLIDERYCNGKSIILTTNLDYPQLEAHIGGACADRLREMCGSNFIKMAGKSYRNGKTNANLPNES